MCGIAEWLIYSSSLLPVAFPFARFSFIAAVIHVLVGLSLAWRSFLFSLSLPVLFSHTRYFQFILSVVMLNMYDVVGSVYVRCLSPC